MNLESLFIALIGASISQAVYFTIHHFADRAQTDVLMEIRDLLKGEQKG